MRKLSLDESHERLLEIGKLFHGICQNHGIPYYMMYGTMLGAVRHKGFIPWDDDIDMGVPRQYYEKLLAILKREVKAPYRVLTCENAGYPLCFIKIDDTRTVINDPQRTNKERLSVGLNLDVFPLDECSTQIELVLPYIKKKEYDIKMITAIYLSFVHNSFLKSIGRVAVKLLYMTKNIPYWIKRDDEIVAGVSGTGTGAIINISGIIYGVKEITPKDYFGTPTLYDFEGMQFYGVEHPDKLLTHLYGNYMEIPPENKRHVHSLDIFAK